MTANPVNLAADVGPINLRRIWTDSDEEKLLSLLARRKASGEMQRNQHGRPQLLTIGDRRPNPNTVPGTIYALAGLQGIVLRRDLLADMAETAFPYQGAEPTNAKWCHHHITEALRLGFLKVLDQTALPLQLNNIGAVRCK